MKQIKVAKLREDAIVPTRKHSTDAGVDLYCVDEYVSIGFGSFEIVHTGITVEIPKGYVGLVWPKSRTNFVIGGGVIDSGYQGEILVKLINATDGMMYVKKNDAIAQLVIQKVETPEVVEVSNLHEVKTVRGTTGGIVTQVETVAE